ncbi:hypothetical protein P154DRAFT_536566 [Amniculicola lignicola CBS 123094]|uniref:Uncharacterized protein n=1 Tax=Amniculicola lignicola CBS 123094 TaxID=1392246 RepID=A0A6A5W880_9PLEO|nr:hypothetical protein P154DRAFT_536566 [Amniculicola lignicola CBS 123094]
MVHKLHIHKLATELGDLGQAIIEQGHTLILESDSPMAVVICPDEIDDGPRLSKAHIFSLRKHGEKSQRSFRTHLEQYALVAVESDSPITVNFDSRFMGPTEPNKGLGIMFIRDRDEADDEKQLEKEAGEGKKDDGDEGKGDAEEKRNVLSESAWRPISTADLHRLLHLNP